jgi:hypothetical protein
MTPMTRSLAAALLMAAAFPAAAAAGAADRSAPAVRETAAGTAAARASLLTRGDLGTGWTASATRPSGLLVSCSGHRPSGAGIVETGDASSPTFAAGKVGPFIVQVTSVYASDAQASAYWRRAVTAGLVGCARQSLQTITARGIRVKVLSQGDLPVANVAPMTAAYRVVATLSSPAERALKTYVDWILVGRGRELTEIMISSFQLPPADFENALAVIANARMGGGHGPAPRPAPKLPTA